MELHILKERKTIIIRKEKRKKKQESDKKYTFIKGKFIVFIFVFIVSQRALAITMTIIYFTRNINSKLNVKNETITVEEQ